MLSPPSRRRGLKYTKIGGYTPAEEVASLAEAWIEIYFLQTINAVQLPSPPSRRRGLKFDIVTSKRAHDSVASLAEAWIEISSAVDFHTFSLSRLPRGGVD